MRKLVIALGAVLVLAVANFGIYGREQLLSHGQVVFLELAPVDPRSLMQGDFMALRFRVANDAWRADGNLPVEDGRIVLSVDDRRVGHYARRYDGGNLAPQEVLLRYRVRDGNPRFATNAFFFREGTAEQYRSARYGEFHVDAKGDAILTALRDAELQVLGVALK